MNPFRSRKKSFNDGDSSRRPSTEDAPPVPVGGFRGKTFRRKKQQPEVKKQVNIAAALPSSDDFRTSLLMPNLSARFSMLREQDDPNTKIGKANDDSVLFPKRASRLNLFGASDLGDIDEGASLADPIRPPFATERNGSYSSADGYGTDDEEGKSIMSRSRQVKGNKFFANRQKIYMIPAEGSVSMKDLRRPNNASDKVPRSMGKAVYDDDINASTFKTLTGENPRQRSDDERHSDDRERRGSFGQSDSNSKRETSSSTNSGPPDSRASTAATSVASQAASPMHGPASNNTSFPFTKQGFGGAGQERNGKGKRLYGQGIDQQIHEQQSSALHRLNSIQRPFGVPQSRSATNLNDRFQKPGQLYSANNFRTMSPVPGSSSSLTGFDFGTQSDMSRSNSRETDCQSNTSPTRSPPMSPTDPLTLALEPNDLGKATATGAFNKPKTSYNDEQFAQRQMQLQEGRETPSLSSFSRPGAYNSLAGRDRNGSLASQISGNSTNAQFKPQTTGQGPPASLHLRKQEAPGAMNRPVNGTYLATRSDSEYGSEPNSPADLAATRTAAQPTLSQVVDSSSRHRKYEHDDQHPAFSNYHGMPEEDHTDEMSQHLPLQPTDGNSAAINISTSANTIDSPTLPTADENLGISGGLNDLIRGHLRNVSNTSSIYPNDPPSQSHEFFLDGQDTLSGENGMRMPNSVVESHLTESEQVPADPLQARARRILEQANQLKNAPTKPYEVLGGVGANKVQQVLGGEAPRRSNEISRPSNVAWQESVKGHARGASTETQKEREEFANELADRRKQVQQNLKSFVEEARPDSPIGARDFDNSPARAGPLGLLKKASRSSIVGRSENPSKAMKMLGVGSAPSQPPTGPTNHAPSATSPEGFAGHRPVLNSDIRQRVPRDQAFKVKPGDGPSFRERSIGVERRAAFQRGILAPANPGPERAISAKQPSPKPNGYGFARSNTDNFNNPQNPGHPAARPRKYSPPATVSRQNEHLNPGPQAMRSASAQGHYSSAAQSQYSSNSSHFPTQQRSPNLQANAFPPAFIDSPRASPVTGAFPMRGTPPMEQPSTMAKTGSGSSQSQRPPQHRKRSINKDEISNPTFMSSTSTVITVDLPTGASLANGMDEGRAGVPPVPPLNPRRRKGAPTQGLFTSFVNKSSHNLSALSTPSSAATSPHSGTPFLEHPPPEEKSNFSSDDDHKQPRTRARLRKSSSDGGNMAARARHQALKEMDKMPMTPVYAAPDNSARMF